MTTGDGAAAGTGSWPTPDAICTQRETRWRSTRPPAFDDQIVTARAPVDVLDDRKAEILNEGLYDR